MPLDLKAIKELSERYKRDSDPEWGSDGDPKAYELADSVPPLVSEVESLRAVVDAVIEWQRGCSNAHPDRPEECPDCTRVFSEVVRERLASAIREEP